MSTGKAAKLLGVSVKTLQRWEREGRLVAVARTDSNRRLYTETQIRQFIGLHHSVSEPTRLVAYCRVSSAAQKPDLANQRKVLEEFTVAKGLANVEFVEEVGGGLNFKRKRFLALMDEVGCMRLHRFGAIAMSGRPPSKLHRSCVRRKFLRRD